VGESFGCVCGWVGLVVEVLVCAVCVWLWVDECRCLVVCVWVRVCVGMCVGGCECVCGCGCVYGFVGVGVGRWV
jgi:hypothetical protein